MRFHVVSLPHTNTTSAFQSCAYTEKVRKFCRMMFGRGHAVFLYGGAFNEVLCTEHIACISNRERIQAVGKAHYTQASFDPNAPHWQSFTKKAIQKIQKRIEPGDFICVIAGLAQKPIADAFPEHRTVEFGVGYGGTFSQFRVFESYAWQHMIYGARSNNNPHGADGTWFDTVIPGYLEPEQFPPLAKKSDYILYVGRLITRKGVNLAADICQRARKRLVVAGFGDVIPTSCECVGEVNAEKRQTLMSEAYALIAPTVYVEPFGNVAIEAMACGTPVIATDWGAFTETVVPGKTGVRCRMLSEFLAAIKDVKFLRPDVIQEHARSHYGLGTIGGKYEAHFDRLSALQGGSWYA